MVPWSLEEETAAELRRSCGGVLTALHGMAFITSLYRPRLGRCPMICRPWAPIPSPVVVATAPTDCRVQPAGRFYSPPIVPASRFRQASSMMAEDGTSGRLGGSGVVSVWLDSRGRIYGSMVEARSLLAQRRWLLGRIGRGDCRGDERTGSGVFLQSLWIIPFPCSVLCSSLEFCGYLSCAAVHCALFHPGPFTPYSGAPSVQLRR